MGSLSLCACKLKLLLGLKTNVVELSVFCCSARSVENKSSESSKNLINKFINFLAFQTTYLIKFDISHKD